MLCIERISRARVIPRISNCVEFVIFRLAQFGLFISVKLKSLSGKFFKRAGTAECCAYKVVLYLR
jgi:hypothetical protein